jgi:hypothetical protein
MEIPLINIQYPAWLAGAINWEQRYLRDDDKMAVAILLSRLNVTHGTGEPLARRSSVATMDD